MLVRNYMHPHPLTIDSDTLVSEAKRLISENNLHALPVVENGRLRGLVTRAGLLRMGQFVLRTQDSDEFNFFVTRLKVKDVMLRSPATVQASDTMEHCLLKGQELGVAQFPVMDGDQVVGVISANEIFQYAARCLGARERRSGVTLAPLRMGTGTLVRIAQICESAGAPPQAIYPVGRRDEGNGNCDAARPVIVRFHTRDISAVIAALEAAGYPVDEAVQSELPAMAA
jgi:acetoin utilization protein AcuB